MPSLASPSWSSMKLQERYLTARHWPESDKAPGRNLISIDLPQFIRIKKKVQNMFQALQCHQHLITSNYRYMAALSKLKSLIILICWSLLGFRGSSQVLCSSPRSSKSWASGCVCFCLWWLRSCHVEAAEAMSAQSACLWVETIWSIYWNIEIWNIINTLISNLNVSEHHLL